jgi:hypothetical protein
MAPCLQTAVFVFMLISSLFSSDVFANRYNIKFDGYVTCVESSDHLQIIFYRLCFV